MIEFENHVRSCISPVIEKKPTITNASSSPQRVSSTVPSGEVLAGRPSVESGHVNLDTGVTKSFQEILEILDETIDDDSVPQVWRNPLETFRSRLEYWQGDITYYKKDLNHLCQEARYGRVVLPALEDVRFHLKQVEGLIQDFQYDE